MKTEITALQRLEDLLNAKDEELDELREQLERTQRELRGALDGWRSTVEIVEDASLPCPRLELCYEQIDNWRQYQVVYRLVHRHLNGDYLATPLGRTTVNGSGSSPPDPGEQDLPFRDGCHAHHDAAHLRLRLFKVFPGQAPLELCRGYEVQQKLGAEHRR